VRHDHHDLDRDARDDPVSELLRSAAAGHQDLRDADHRSRGAAGSLDDRRARSQDEHQGLRDHHQGRPGRCGWGASGDERREPYPCQDASRGHRDHRDHLRSRDADAGRSAYEDHQEAAEARCRTDAGQSAAG
jgi:hypothetical protein